MNLTYLNMKRNFRRYSNEYTKKLQKPQKELSFSGAFYAQKGANVFTGSNGFQNRSEKINNQVKTRFSVASGSKIFTSVAICMLVEMGKISFGTKLIDCLNIDFPHFDKEITIHSLLTHTSGVPDYFDEEEMDDYEMLWESKPMYHMRSPKDFLSMFQDQRMQGEVGSPFRYNNAGYIILGLVVEHVAQCSFTDFVEKHIFQKANMKGSGYFEMDRLPTLTAFGYIDEPDGTWKSNMYAIPVKGGPDGGAYVTVEDMEKFWKALISYELLSEEMTHMLFKPRVVVAAEDNIYYGYAGYMEVNDNREVIKYIQMGYDPGVNYRAVYDLKSDMLIVVCSNKSEGAYELLKEIENIL